MIRPASVTLIDLLTRTYAPRRLNLKPRTIEAYSLSIGSISRHLGRDATTEDLTEDTVLAWLSERKGKCADRTLKRERNDVLMLWRFAAKRGLCHPPQEDDIPHVRVRPKRPIAWTLTQVERIVAECRSLRGTMRDTGISQAAWWSSFVLFLYDTGGRLSASLAVKPSDLSIEGRYVVLDADDAKTDVPEQVVSLSDQTIAAIAAHYSRCRDRVWPYPWHRRKIWLDFKRILSDAGLPTDSKSMFHRLRRTNATLATAYGSLEIARQQLGHTSTAMTRVYVDPTIAVTQQAVDVLPRPVVGDRQLRLF